ncbi:MAG: hypothetical protein KGJ32_14410 [Xanthomonadaceae bacterium]|nr:hypothetical protein [Xanthomonadaceae bacterium]
MTNANGCHVAAAAGAHRDAMGNPADLAAAIGRTRLRRLRHASEPAGCEVPTRTGLPDPALLHEEGMPVPDWLALPGRGGRPRLPGARHAC